MSDGRPDLSGIEDRPPSTPMTILAVRFLLELFAWAGFGVWGWHLGDGGVTGGTLAVIFTLLSMVIWGVFRVRHDPPGKTDQPVVVPGWVRLAIELGTFAIAAYGLWVGWNRAAAETLLTCVVVLYVVTWDRQRWLLRQ